MPPMTKYFVVSIWENDEEYNIEMDFFDSVKDIRSHFDSYMESPVDYKCWNMDTQEQVDIELF